MLEAERGDVERDAGVDTFLPPVEPLLEDNPQPPLGQLVDQAMFLGERHEMRRLDGAELRILPADQRFDLPEAAVTYRDLRLVDHVQLLPIERSLEPVDQLQLELRAHGTSVALSLARRSSSTSKRTGFSTGPAMLRPRASPRRKADSSTRRSKPLTIRTGPR